MKTEHIKKMPIDTFSFVVYNETVDGIKSTTKEE